MLLSVLKRVFARNPSRLQPSVADFTRAYQLYEGGALDEAEAECRRCVRTAHADREFLLGLIAEKRGAHERAVTHMAAAIEARPDEAAFHEGLARVLGRLGRVDEAIDHVDRVLELTAEGDARRPAACAAAARWLRNRDPARAREWLDRTLAVSGADTRGILLVSDALFEESDNERARELAATHPRARAYPHRLRRTLMLPAVYASPEHIEATRERFDGELEELLAGPADRIEDPVAQVGYTAFYLAYHNANNVALLRKLCAAMRRGYPARATGAARRPRGARARVGFVSTNFYSHSVGRTTLGLIRDLPRERFEVYVFAVDPQRDALQSAIERAADRYASLPARLEAVRSAIESAELDVLVYADVGMQPLTTFLALWRLAPLQVATWGHSETTGIDTIDCYLSARGVEIESAQSHYSERLLRPDAFFLPGYARPGLEAPLGRNACGLAADRRLYACLQPPFKLHPDMDAIFRGILDRDPAAEILLLAPMLAWRERLAQRLAPALGAEMRRVRFLDSMPHARYLATLAACDVALDPLYFGGCNSSCEAIALGVPVVTLPGDHLYGRFTLGLYTEMEVERGIASSTDDYVTRAVEIARERHAGAGRDAFSAQLLERSAAVFERRDLALAFGEWLEQTVFS